MELKDRDLDNQVSVRFDDWTIAHIDKVGGFRAEVVRKCVMRCIREDNKPAWKRTLRRWLRL